MRHISQKGVDLIKEFEGFREKVYQCPAGFDTIGYGHLLKPPQTFSNGINKTQAARLLRYDLLDAETAVLRLIDVDLSDCQFDALVSFAFNLGASRLQGSTLRKELNQGKYDKVPSELMRWVWAGGKKLDGLERRRSAEAALFTQDNKTPQSTTSVKIKQTDKVPSFAIPKPIKIEFMEYDGSHERIKDIQAWMGGPRHAFNTLEGMGIKTREEEGYVVVLEGTFIIKGVTGEFYRYKADVFRKSYNICEEG